MERRKTVGRKIRKYNTCLQDEKKSDRKSQKGKECLLVVKGGKEKESKRRDW